MNRENSKARDIAILAIMTAIIEALKLALAPIANVELTSFLLIMFTLHFGKKVFFVIPAFTVIEILIFGFEPMWVMAYCYVWPILFFLTLIFSKHKSAFSMTLLSGFFGLGFGFLCSFPYLFATTSLNPTAGLASAIAYWIAGIPFDIVHGVANAVIMLVLYEPVSKMLQRINCK